MFRCKQSLRRWRGRIYTQSFFANYQGGDLALSLIEFYNGECLSKNGINSLYIYGANNYNENNISKAPYTDRINWVQENYENIITCAVAGIRIYKKSRK